MLRYRVEYQGRIISVLIGQIYEEQEDDVLDIVGDEPVALCIYKKKPFRGTDIDPLVSARYTGLDSRHPLVVPHIVGNRGVKELAPDAVEDLLFLAQSNTVITREESSTDSIKRRFGRITG